MRMPEIAPTPSSVTLRSRRTLSLGRCLGKGRLGSVYAGELASGWIRRPVAVRLFDAIASEDRVETCAALGRSASRAALVVHPNVVATLEYDAADGACPLLVTELVAGCSLGALLGKNGPSNGRPRLEVALFVAVEITEALTAALHAQALSGEALGLVHGDLTADSVLLSQHGEVKVSEFAYTQALSNASSARRVHRWADGLKTVAPEVISNVVDARSDVFSLGVLLHEMLVGPRFKPQLGDRELFDWVSEGRVHRSILDPKLPEELDAIVSRALDPEPSRRYPDAQALGYALRRVALGMGVGDARMFLRETVDEVVASEACANSERTPVRQSGSVPRIPPATEASVVPIGRVRRRG